MGLVYLLGMADDVLSLIPAILKTRDPGLPTLGNGRRRLANAYRMGGRVQYPLTAARSNETLSR